jgi:hypothetical protein
MALPVCSPNISRVRSRTPSRFSKRPKNFGSLASKASRSWRSALSRTERARVSADCTPDLPSALKAISRSSASSLSMPRAAASFM